MFEQIKNEDDEFDWGIIINFKKEGENDSSRRKKGNPMNSEPTIIVDVLLHVASIKSEEAGKPKPCIEGDDGEVEVVPVLHTLISKISSLRVYYPKDLRPPDNRKSVIKTIQVNASDAYLS